MQFTWSGRHGKTQVGTYEAMSSYDKRDHSFKRSVNSNANANANVYTNVHSGIL